MAPLPASPTGPLDKRQVEWLLSLWGQCMAMSHTFTLLVSCDRAPLPASPTGPLDKRQVEWLLSLWGQCVAGGSLDKMQNVMKRLPLVQRRQLTDTVCTANPMLITCCWQGCTHMVHYLLDECGADIEKEGKSRG